jgi:hypothetical protein
MKRFLFYIIIIFLSTNFTVVAQTVKQNSGWFLFLNNTKINKKWGAYFDMQLRTTDDYKKVRNLLLRPGITYYLSPKQEITLGYLLNPTYVYQSSQLDYHLTEHRIWEQYVFKHKLKAIAVNHRFRLEQRFIERYQAKDLFSQRFRYFFRFIIPLQKELQNFEKGAYLALQNEIFLNLQNKDELNTHVFDQNRAYGALGYRLNKKIDLEVGYLNQYSKGAVNNTINNVIQVAVYTKF